MNVKRLESASLYSGSRVTRVDMGNIILIKYTMRKNSTISTQKINKDEYVMLETGELFKYNHSTNRGDNLKGIRESIGNLRNLINNNFSGGKNELWITLTFGDNKVYEPKKLYRLFELFIKRLRYELNEKLDYIYVPEPHEKGDWHIHLLLKSNFNKLYISNKKLNEIWGHGFVKVNRLADIDNIGAYVSSYLISIKEGEKTKKGERLYLYPPGHRLYRYSKGIIKPEEYITTFDKAIKDLKPCQLTYKNTVEITNEEGFRNVIHYEYYNKRRN